MESNKKTSLRRRRHQRLRKKVIGTPERPRIAVFKSLKHFYAQAIDDTAGRTIVAACSLTPELKDSKNNKETAKAVALQFSDKIKKAGITRVVFDHGGFGYRGKIKLFADTLRGQGLEF